MHRMFTFLHMPRANTRFRLCRHARDGALTRDAPLSAIRAKSGSSQRERYQRYGDVMMAQALCAALIRALRAYARYVAGGICSAMATRHGERQRASGRCRQALIRQKMRALSARRAVMFAQR